jgi:hypothetical protein
MIHDVKTDVIPNEAKISHMMQRNSHLHGWVYQRISSLITHSSLRPQLTIATSPKRKLLIHYGKIKKISKK